MNKFKIITPSYNNEKWISTYADSILNQTYSNFHVIYINDDSTDDTHEMYMKYIGNNPKFTYIRNIENKGALYNVMTAFETYCEDDDIIIQVDGDDWLSDYDVLKKLNDEYTNNDYWISYGKMYVYDGSDVVKEAYPQNSHFHPFVHKHQYYRKDTWRSSHLRAFRKFLYDKIDKSDFISHIDNELYWHASDLALMYPMLEMCPIEKIGVIKFPTYIYNTSTENQVRTMERESDSNTKYEYEIRNKKIYRRCTDRSNLICDKLPQINVIGDFRERNSIPTKFSYTYNNLYGEFDITLIQDESILQYLDGKYPIIQGKIIADIHEPIYLFNQQKVYDRVYENYTKFDLILTHDVRLLTLPNALFRNSGHECVLNKNIHELQHPILSDPSLYKIYEKDKICSFISSNKQFTEGHRFRIECLNYVNDNCNNVDIFGKGIRDIVGKIDALQDYQFSIAIENGISINYFTEKILDCFLTGTIPIYNGCPNISDFFNINGFYTFDTKEELVEILNNISTEEYMSKKKYIKSNYMLACEYELTSDKLYDKYFKRLI